MSEFNINKHLCEVYELLLKDQVVIGLALSGERVQGYLWSQLWICEVVVVILVFLMKKTIVCFYTIFIYTYPNVNYIKNATAGPKGPKG